MVSFILNSALRSLSIKAISAVLGFLVGVVIAQKIGPEGVGAYYFSYSLILVLATISKMGQQNSLLKLASVASDGELPKLFFSSLVTVFAAGCTLLIIYFFVYSWAAPYLSIPDNYKSYLLYVPFAFVPYALTFVCSSLSQAKGYISIAMLGQNAITYFFVVLLCYFFLGKGSPEKSIVYFALASVVSFVFSFYMASRLIGSWGAVFPLKGLGGRWLSGLEFLSVDILNVAINWAPLFVLGFFVSSADLGVYSVASRISWMLAFFLFSVNSAVAPILAKRYADDDKKGLKAVYSKSVLVVFVVTFVPCLLVILWPGFFMLFFGQEFLPGADILRLLAFGQVANALCGPVNFLLMMTGYSRFVTFSSLAALIVSIAIILAFVGDMGVMAAAYAFVISVIIQKALMVFYAKKYVL